MNHLFIEGNVRIGKSTLIRTYVQPYSYHLGGFSCQRLLGTRGDIAGYRLAPGSDLRISVPNSEDMENVFMTFKSNTVEKNLQVFRDAGVSYLEDNQDKAFILMDEIGGIELLVPEFMDALYRCLNGPIPCIGVLKQEEATRSSKVKALNRELRQDLRKKTNITLLNFQNSTTEKQVKEFIDSHA